MKITLGKRYKPEICTAKNDMRPAMKQIHFENDKCIATDGHIMCVLPAKIEGKGNIAVNDFRAIRKAVSKRGDFEIEATEEIYSVEGCKIANNGDSEIFPSWESVLPKDAPVFITCFDLNLFVRAAQTLGADKVTMRFFKHRKGHILEIMPYASEATVYVCGLEDNNG